MGRLGGRVDDQLQALGAAGENPLDTLGISHIDLQRAKLGIARHQLLGSSSGGGVGTEEPGAHVVLEPDHVPPRLDQVANGLRADQSTGAGDDGGRHLSSRSGAGAGMTNFHAALTAETLPPGAPL